MDAHRFLGCESELRVRSYGCVHRINEGDGPRHASCETVPPSNLGRPQSTVGDPTAVQHCTAAGHARQVAVVLGFVPFYSLDLAGPRPDNAENARATDSFGH